MSSLWSAFDRIKNSKNRTPSPTSKKALSSLKSREKNKFCKALIERISVPVSEGESTQVHASMTLEAALILPMVMFFFLHIMGFIEMLRLHGKLSFALWECGNQLTVYAAMPGELEKNVPDIAISYLYAGNRIKSFLGKDYLNASPILQGSSGLNFLNSAYEENCIDIGVTYQVKPKITLFPFPYIRMVNRYYGRGWTGYDLREDTRFVYVTLYGEVWHATAECTHIYITIIEMNYSLVKRLRNESGERYSVCELCRDDEVVQNVYYTEQGNRYHHNRNCSALVRYISAISWQEQLPYRPCERCVKEEKTK